MEAFYMKIIMRRDSVIFYFENNRIDNAVRRCLLNKTKPFYLELVLIKQQYKSYMLFPYEKTVRHLTDDRRSPDSSYRDAYHAFYQHGLFL